MNTKTVDLASLLFYKPSIMWNTNTLWFEVAIVSILLLLGHIFLGHFEERAPKWKKFFKYLLTVAVVISISIFFGRTIAFILLGLSLIPVLYIHMMLLPKKGINGWTGEPKSKYYEFRGWSKDIFQEKKNDIKDRQGIKDTGT